MPRFWTHHWQNRVCTPEYNFGVFCSSGGNDFLRKGMSPGDIAYVVTIKEGYLIVGGRMTVQRIVDRDEAVRIWDNDNLWDAEEWLIDESESGTDFNFGRRLAPEVTRQLWFESPNGVPKQLFFKTRTKLDGQTTRGVRELTEESAWLLDQIIEVTDAIDLPDEFEVTTDFLDGILAETETPDDSSSIGTYEEGSPQPVLVTRFERSRRARAECIELRGVDCLICGFNFEGVYGIGMSGFIHIHHIEPLGAKRGRGETNPRTDLVPLCPNCHAVVHSRIPAYSVDEVIAVRETCRANKPSHSEPSS